MAASRRPVPRYLRGDWPKIRQQVLIRDRFQCRMGLPGCTTKANSVDHIVSPRDGGTNDLSNLRAACRHCNSLDGVHRRNGTRPHQPSREW